MELDKIYLMDCLEGMAKLPDGSIDMILCDLPYGTTENAWDKKLPLDALWREYKRVAKETAAICLFAQMPFGAELIMSNKPWFRYEWIMEKTKAVGFLNAKKMPLRAHENILVFYNKLPTYNPQKTRGKPYTRVHADTRPRNYGKKRWYVTVNTDGSRYPKDIIKVTSLANTLTSKRHIFHPTQKPLFVCEYLIKTYTNKGETVLDNCMGSGTTAVAALNTGRHFVGFELNEEYWRAANERIESEQAQMKLEIA